MRFGKGWTYSDDAGTVGASWHLPSEDPSDFVAKTGVAFCVLCSTGSMVSTSILTFKAVDREQFEKSIFILKLLLVMVYHSSQCFNHNYDKAKKKKKNGKQSTVLDLPVDLEFLLMDRGGAC